MYCSEKLGFHQDSKSSLWLIRINYRIEILNLLLILTAWSRGRGGRVRGQEARSEWGGVPPGPHPEETAVPGGRSGWLLLSARGQV